MKRMNDILKVLEFTADKAQSIAAAQSVAGDPIVIGEVTVIPISAIACGFAGGGSDLPARQKSDALMAGAGAKVSMTPLSFLAVCGRDVQILRVSQQEAAGGLMNALKPLAEKMAAGNSLAQAFYEEKIFEPLYNRMLLSGARSGQLENVLERLSKVFSAEADTRIELLIGNIEPILSGLLTLAVGLTLLSVMLPLVGILAAVG